MLGKIPDVPASIHPSVQSRQLTCRAAEDRRVKLASLPDGIVSEYPAKSELLKFARGKQRTSGKLINNCLRLGRTLLFQNSEHLTTTKGLFICRFIEAQIFG